MTSPSVNVPVVRLPHGEGLPLPAYATPASAGMDLIAAVPADAPLVIRPGDWALVPTGLSIELPEGYEAQVRPRSGLALKFGLSVLNAPGTIDADYRGEVGVLLINHGREAFEITRGLRIAQMVVAAVVQIKLVESGNLGETARGAGGFGSTGLDAASHSR
ncbi:dUTP diphosphatase [Xanthobacteraceae bacterium A53D]